jgi:hypothetical protein
MEDASTEFLPVANFPAGEGLNFDDTTAVCADQLNRIYIFGGQSQQTNYIMHHEFGTSTYHRLQ